MASRNLELESRRLVERDNRPEIVPRQFTLEEIMEHFLTSLGEIERQFDVADRLLKEGNSEGCRIIWRSQVVLAEGLLDFYIHEMSKYCLFVIVQYSPRRNRRGRETDFALTRMRAILRSKIQDARIPVAMKPAGLNSNACFRCFRDIGRSRASMAQLRFRC